MYKEGENARGENIRLDVFPLEGDCWEDSLSKELIIDDEVKASNAEIAACCLWHASFYGYLPYQREETFDDMFDGIEKRSTLLSLYKEKFLDIIPSNRDFLTAIIEAMKDNMVISITHKNFTHKKSYMFPVEPYCLKMFQKRWYLLAKSINDGKIRIYGLDRLENVELTTERFSMPRDFNAKEYFSTFFGIVTDENVAVERIVIRAYKQHQLYVRSLPIHSSQKELYACDAYADFELRLRPTYDFGMELLHAGEMIEVIEPKSLRHTMKEWAKSLWELYKQD